MDVFFQIKNAGASDVTVLCPKKPLIIDATPSYSVIELVYRLRLPTGIAGVREIVPAVHEVSPVVLKPGEITEVRLSSKLPRGVTPEKVVFRYTVDERFGQRFSGWFGDIVTPVRSQPIGGRYESIPWSKKKPNKAPEPTPGSVTPRASE